MYKSILSTTILTLLFLLLTETGKAQLSGNYTINSTMPTAGTNYQSFNDFAANINSVGVSASVTVTVEPGTGPYIEQVIFDNIPGSGPTATITLNGNGEVITAITNTTDRHVIRLKDVQYFTITDLRVIRDTASTSGFYGIHIFSTGNHINIDRCKVEMPATTSTLVGGFIASGSETSILETGDFHNITFTNDTTIGGGYGASVFGLVSNLASNIVISNNVFYDFHSNGIYLRETNGAVISGNFFDKRTANITSVNYIQIAQAENINAQIFNNFLTVSQTSNGTMIMRGIYLFNGTGHKVYNNIIYDVDLISGDFTGIEVRTGGTAPEIYFNTVSVDNPTQTSGELLGFAESLGNTGSILKNNIFSLSQPTTGLKAGIAIATSSNPTSAITSDHNLVWAPGGNFAVKASLTPVLYPTINDWQTVSIQDMNSHYGDPVFTSLINLVPTSSLADNMGTPVGFVTTDITGTLRGPTPDIGAYEFTFVGIQDLEPDHNLVAYPNPSSSSFIIKSDFGLIDNISIYNSKGQLISDKLFSSLLTPQVISVSTEMLVDGIYFIRLSSKGKISAAKFLVKH